MKCAAGLPILLVVCSGLVSAAPDSAQAADARASSAALSALVTPPPRAPESEHPEPPASAHRTDLPPIDHSRQISGSAPHQQRSLSQLLPHPQDQADGERSDSKAIDAALQKAEALLAKASVSRSAGNDRPPMGMSMMQMVFYGGSHMSLWFKGFKVDTAGEWVAACLGLVLMAALYEGLKTWRVILANKYDDSGFTSIGHGIQTVLHLVQVTTSYFLMLAVMTYSSWVMISVCAGAMLGYYVFATFVPTASLLGGLSDHCH